MMEFHASEILGWVNFVIRQDTAAFLVWNEKVRMEHGFV